MSIFTPIINAFKWLGSKISSGAKASIPAAIVITEALKTFLANPLAGFLENLADTITGTNTPTAVANDINALIPKILATELAIEGLPANATPAEVLAFEQSVLSAFNVKNDNSKLYTTFAAQVYGKIEAAATGTTPPTFATLVADVEELYAEYQTDLAANMVMSPSITPVQLPQGTITASPAITDNSVS